MQLPVRHFAVPNGRNEDFTEEIIDFCRNGGFASTCTTNFGHVGITSDPYKLPRVCPSDCLFVFAVELARYMFFKRIV